MPELLSPNRTTPPPRTPAPRRRHRRADGHVAALVAALATVAAAAIAPGSAAAHPLGNFTINHYAGIRVTPTDIRLDVVIDVAEIPAVEQHARFDLDRDGAVSPAEAETARLAACPALAPELDLRLDAIRLALRPIAAGLAFPVGAGDLPTIRTTCLFVADRPAGAGGPASLTFRDGSFAGRAGWREITAEGDRVALGGSAPDATSISGRLRAYPEDLLTAPLAMADTEFTVLPGGPALPPLEVADAARLPGAGLPDGLVVANGSTSGPGSAVIGAVVPGGIGAELEAIVAFGDLEPLAIGLSLGLALVLGAAHALTPGHGKTIIAAYLVGSRGSARQAVGLGLAVTASHTAGVLVLAVLATLLAGVLPPDRLFPVLVVASGLMFVGLGGWLLWTQARAWRGRRRDRHAHEREHELAHAGGLEHDHAPDHNADAPDHTHAHARADLGEHRHLGIRHRHAPLPEGGLTVRSLVALGVAGGLVPSVSALVLLLGSIAAGRPAYGIVLVVAFGLGMAAVLTGIGLLFVRARMLLERMGAASRFAIAVDALPVAAAAVVVAAGLWMTTQALGVAT
jgi:ABC-type nickel/cobalt efflux system permease component RcnA